MMAFRILMYGSRGVSALVYLANVRQVRTLARGGPPVVEEAVDATIVDTTLAAREPDASLEPDPRPASRSRPIASLPAGRASISAGEDDTFGDPDVDGADDPLGVDQDDERDRLGVVSLGRPC